MAATVVADTIKLSLTYKNLGIRTSRGFLFYITPNRIKPTVFIAKFANICTNQDG